MRAPSRPFRPALIPCLRAIALALVTACLAAWQYDRLDPASWSSPTDYSGDAMEVMARFKAVSEGELVPFTRQVISRLGAPFGTDWSEYPASDGLLFFLLGNLARVIGVGAACNVALLLAHVMAALSFYLCARWLRHRWEWAFAGALLFSFTFHTVFRGLSHLSLVFTWTVPPALLCCALIARSRRIERYGRTWWLCLAMAAVLAVSNPYNLFLFLQLLGWSLVAQWTAGRRADNLQAGLLSAGLAVGLFALVLLPTWVYRNDENGSPLLVRNYGGTELYALKPIELVLPPAVHRSEWLASLGERYVRWSDWRGETFSPYLGLVAGAALVWLFAEVILRLFARRRAAMPGQALPAAWVLAFSVVGGINSMLAFYFGLQIFRATNRYSIFLSALALMFLVARLSRLSGRWPRGLSVGLAFALVFAGLWDQLPRPDQRAAEAAEILRRDRAFGAELERVLPRGGMLYQLPYLEFPEGRAIRDFYEYEHFRPYLATEHLHFTFGARKSRARSRWQRDYEQLSPDRLVPALERAGFAGIYLNRRAYEDRGEKLVRALRSAAQGQMIEGARGDQVVVLLRPSPRPEFPLARGPTYGRGWNPVEPLQRERRWTQGPAAMSYHNPYPRPLPARLRFQISAVGPRRFKLRQNGRLLMDRPVGEQPVEIVLPSLQLSPGVNRFDFSSNAWAERVGKEKNRLRDLAVDDLAFSVESASGFAFDR